MKKHKHKYHFVEKQIVMVHGRGVRREEHYEFICLCGKVKKVEVK